MGKYMISFCCKSMNNYVTKKRKRAQIEMGSTDDIDNKIGLTWESRLWLNMKNPKRKTPCRLKEDIRDRLRKGQSPGSLLKVVRQVIEIEN